MNPFKNIFLLLACVIFCHGSQMIVTMKSGERLIGEVAAASNESTLILNSPLLGELSLPKADILKQEKQVVDATEPSQPAPPKAITGKDLSLSEEEIAHDQKEYLFDKLAKLQTPDSWSGSLRFGLDLGSGNSKWRQIHSNGTLIIDPEQSPNYFRFTGSYTYRTTDRKVLVTTETEAGAVTETVTETVKSVDRYDGNFTYRRDLSGPFFLQNSLGGRVDQIKGINHEVQELVGLGIRLEPTENMELIMGGGGGVEEFDPEFEDTRSGVHPVANFFQEFTWRPFEKVTVAQEFNYFVNPEDNQQYNYVLSASFRYRLTDLLGFEVSYDQNFDNDVGNGNVQDDSRWRNAIIVYF